MSKYRPCCLLSEEALIVDREREFDQEALDNAKCVCDPKKFSPSALSFLKFNDEETITLYHGFLKSDPHDYKILFYRYDKYAMVGSDIKDYIILIHKQTNEYYIHQLGSSYVSTYTVKFNYKNLDENMMLSFFKGKKTNGLEFELSIQVEREVLASFHDQTFESLFEKVTSFSQDIDFSIQLPVERIERIHLDLDPIIKFYVNCIGQDLDLDLCLVTYLNIREEICILSFDGSNDSFSCSFPDDEHHPWDPEREVPKISSIEELVEQRSKTMELSAKDVDVLIKAGHELTNVYLSRNIFQLKLPTIII